MGKIKITSICTLIMIAALTFSYSVNAQTESQQERDYKVRPIRLGLKLGFPNLVGGNLEYVTPLLNDRLAVNLDYSTINSDWFMADEETDGTETTNLDFSYLEGGFNYYFFKAGKGLYGGLSYNQMNFKGETNVESNGREGKGNIDYNHNSFNIKLGARLGGLFYFRPEIGYSFSHLPKTIEYQARYEDGTTETETYDFSEELASADILFKGLMVNIGFGFAF
ncbi:hypothetical protein [Salinimicrobium flavum]|uniref:Outer membrane protein beta-barrel domain-containing protein n=1 Tax=Salinimicrobium flavum TaxID=1737065 RepID=A0ABW5ISG0_9FLAO